MARAFLLSLMVDQYRKVGDAFLEKYNHGWLVWEASAWAAPRADGATRIGHLGLGLNPGKERDALCFGLTFKGDAKQIALGRANDNDIVINDGTVSRHHALLTLSPSGRWQVQPFPSTSGTVSGTRQLSETDVAPLVDRQKLVVGGVELTFYEPKSFLEIVRARWQREQRG
jgi:pSer/pThr/pTyr-binding forkhead associated (FHA) protein